MSFLPWQAYTRRYRVEGTERDGRGQLVSTMASEPVNAVFWAYHGSERITTGDVSQQLYDGIVPLTVALKETDELVGPMGALRIHTLGYHQWLGIKCWQVRAELVRGSV